VDTAARGEIWLPGSPSLTGFPGTDARPGVVKWHAVLYDDLLSDTICPDQGLPVDRLSLSLPGVELVRSFATAKSVAAGISRLD